MPNPWDAAPSIANPWDSGLPVGGVPATNPSPAGFLGNALTGIANIGRGITGLVAAGAQDIYDVGAEAVTLGGHENPGGYSMDDILRAMPAAIKGDYAHRYGGISNIVKGFYEDPIAYIGDVFIAGAAASGIAKVGRTGAVLGKVPFKVVPDATAAAIRGTLTAEAPVAEFGNIFLKQGTAQGLRLSTNPAVRAVQQEAYKLLSLEPEAAALTANLEGLALQRAQQVVRYSENAGLRVLKPAVGKALTGRFTGKILTALRVNTRDIAGDVRDKFTAAAEGATDPERVTEMLMASSMPAYVPPSTAITIPKSGVIPDLPEPVEISPTLDRTFPEPLVHKFAYYL